LPLALKQGATNPACIPRTQINFLQKTIKQKVMKEFMLLFRQPPFDHNTTPQDWQALAKKWKDWVEGLTSKGSFVSNGQRLAMEGKVLKPGGVITDGPFVEAREILGSFIIVKAENLDEATTLAHGCPAIDTGGSVEIRPIFGQ